TNHVTYHARTAFEDDAAAGRDRLLLRLWLSVPNSRALPPGFEVLWGSIEPAALPSASGSVCRARTAARFRRASRCCGAASSPARSAAVSPRPEPGQRRYFTISSSSTSKTSVAPPLITGGRPWSPYAMSDGQTSLLLPPTFII